MFKLDLEKAEEPEIKLPTSAGSQKKQENSRRTSPSASLTTLKPLTLQEMGIPDHLTYLLRNLYAGQEATVGTGHGTTDWFQIGKGVHQEALQLFTFCHKDGVICLFEVIDISPGNLDSSLCFLQPSVSHEIGRAHV